MQVLVSDLDRSDVARFILLSWRGCQYRREHEYCTKEDRGDEEEC